MWEPFPNHWNFPILFNWRSNFVWTTLNCSASSLEVLVGLSVKTASNSSRSIFLLDDTLFARVSKWNPHFGIGKKTQSASFIHAIVCCTYIDTFMKICQIWSWDRTNLDENIAEVHEIYFYNLKEERYKFLIVTIINFNEKHNFHKYYLKYSFQKSDITFARTAYMYEPSGLNLQFLTMWPMFKSHHRRFLRKMNYWSY